MKLFFNFNACLLGTCYWQDQYLTGYKNNAKRKNRISPCAPWLLSVINGAETASGCSAQSYLIGLVNESCNQSAQTKEPVGFDLPAFFFSQQQKNLSDLSHSRHAVISELVRLDLRHFKYYRYHLTVATRTAEHDEQYLKLFFQRWRTFCDLKQFKFACFDQDGTEHLHIVLWSEKPFELGYELPFKAPSLRLQPVSNGWQTPSINGYSLVCLRPHNNAENLF